MSLLDHSPVFIVGAQRGGTTWVQRMLCAHPLIVGGQESHLFSGYLAPLWERWAVERGMREAGGRAVGLACYLTEEEFARQCRELARRVFAPLEQAKPGATVLVEKTPDHALHLPLIKRLFPGAVVLHVLRDGRAVAASLLAARRQRWGRGWTPATVQEAARRWVDWVSTIRRHLPEFERSLTVRYEDLIANGPAALAALFEFLRVPLPREQVEEIYNRFRFDACAAGADSLVLAGQCESGTGAEPAGFFRRGKAEGWAEELSARQRRAVYAVAGELLQELGYLVPPAPAGVRVRRLGRAVRRFSRRLVGLSPDFRSLEDFGSLDGRSGWKSNRQGGASDGPGITHGAAGVRQAGHRAYVGGLWEEVGRLQFEFLVGQGLRPGHNFLDVGCGCLRGGVHFIAYLEPGRYFGLEKEPMLLEAGVREELGAEVLRAKRPSLHRTDDFDCSPFGVPMDFALAQSLFTHLPARLVVACLERVRPAFRAGGRFFATFFECDRERMNPEEPHDHGYFAYTRGQMERFGAGAGWRPEYAGEWGHPRGQRMMRYVAC